MTLAFVVSVCFTHAQCSIAVFPVSLQGVLDQEMHLAIYLTAHDQCNNSSFSVVLQSI